MPHINVPQQDSLFELLKKHPVFTLGITALLLYAVTTLFFFFG